MASLRDHRTPCAALSTLALAVALTASADASTCRYRLWPQMMPFTADMITTPNSVCIFPDGRSTLADAAAGGIDLLLYRVEFFTDAGTWTPIAYDGQGLLLANGPTNLAVCGESSPFMAVDYSGGRPAYFGSQPIHGGGHSPVDGEGRPIGGAIFDWAPDVCGWVFLGLYFNSPDIDGSLSVDLADVPCFAADYLGPYNYRSDFDFDGAVSLSDLAVLAGALGAACAAR